MINIVIPMSGLGSRFANAEYQKPKPFIDVLGKPMIERVIENTKLNDAKYILIARKEHFESEIEFCKSLQNRYNLKFVLIDKLTEGAACTLLFAHRLINNNIPMLMVNSDQIVDFVAQDFIDDANNRKLDGSILTFKAHHPKWSYTKLDSNGFVEYVREKEVISHHATVGWYYFSKGKIFVDSAMDMIARNERVNGEFYVCPTYNFAITQGKKIGIYEINEHLMHGIGTPEDLDLYIKFKQSL